MQHPLAVTHHRPWPLPKKPHRWRQQWLDLLFAHWHIPSSLIQPIIPKPLVLEQEDGMAWIAVVPFKMADVAPRFLPAIPGLSAFPEINLRAYVHYQGKPGVWFFSLDASQPIAVWAAKRMFHLPYFQSKIQMTMQQDAVRYDSLRQNTTNARFSGVYRGKGKVFLSEKGSIEHLLTERYCMYAQNKSGQLFRTEVHHEPWPLQHAELQIQHLELTQWLGFELTSPPDLLHFSKGVRVIAWQPERIL